MKVFYTSRKTLRVLTVLLVLLCVAAAVFGILELFPGSQVELVQRGPLDPLLVSASENLTLYEIRVLFDPEEKELICSQKVDYLNQDDAVFDKLYFHLYPNAFKNKNKPVFPADQMQAAYPKGFSPGWIELSSVEVNGNSADFSIEGTSEDLLMVDLKAGLYPGKRVTISMEYRVKLPHSLGRFGYGRYTYNAANWYPVACVYDDDGWNTDPYYIIGDPFYSDTSNYRVIIEAPKGYVIASTGDILKRSRKGKMEIWEIEAWAVRDFAWVVSDRFKVATTKVGDTTVYSYHLNTEAGQWALEYAADSIRIFSNLFGKYPYRQFSVVQTDFFIGGMEYPNLVMVDRSLYNRFSKTWLEIVTVHEAAHQWWYSMVGNDEIDEAWLDEALAEYSTIMYYGEKYDSNKEESMYNQMILMGKYLTIQELGVDETIDKPIHQFPNWVLYDYLVYGKGAVMLHAMRQEVGNTEFCNILKQYFSDNCFKNATKDDFINACEKVTGDQWDDFFTSWLYGGNDSN
jgi:hypothetical protein